MKLFFVLVAVFCSGFVLASGLASSAWPTFHGSSQHGGRSAVDTSSVDGTVKWVFEAGAGIESSPVIGSDGTIYFGAHDGFLYAVRANGSLKWKFRAGAPNYDERWDVSKAIMATPAIASDGTVYVYSSSNYLHAVDESGNEKWRFPVKWHNDFWSSPTIGLDGTVYIGSARTQSDMAYDGGLLAVNPDGTKKWLFPGDSGVTSTAAVGKDGTIYFGGNLPAPGGAYGNLGVLYALTPQGEKKWEFKFDNWMESSPAVGDDGTIYTGTGREAKFYAFNPDGSVKWVFQAQTGDSAVPAIGKDGNIYVGAWDSWFYSLNAEDGTLRWKYKTPDAFEGVTSSAAVGADGTVYVGSNSGMFYAFNEDGSVKWVFNETHSPIITSPAIGSDGTVYFGAWDKKLYAIGGTDEETDGLKKENASRKENCTQEEIDYLMRIPEPVYCPQENACVRWNYDGTNCYEHANCTQGTRCNLIIKNVDGEGGEFSFETKAGKQSSFIEAGHGQSFGWSASDCDYWNLSIPTKTACEETAKQQNETQNSETQKGETSQNKSKQGETIQNQSELQGNASASLQTTAGAQNNLEKELQTQALVLIGTTTVLLLFAAVAVLVFLLLKGRKKGG